MRKKPYLPLNLQLFAGGDEDDKKDEVTFTPEQQAEIERQQQEAIAAALAAAAADTEAKTAEAIAAAVAEAERVAKLTAEQKSEYEKQKAADDLAKREADITRRELRAKSLEELATKGLPKSLADILDYTDAAKTQSSLATVETAFRAAVEETVNERLKSEPPKTSGAKNNTAPNPWAKDTWNLTQQGRLLREQPELAAQLATAAGVKLAK